MTSKERRFRGFTLVESFVIIGIVAIIIAMLVPMRLRTKALAQKVTCASQLRQVATVFRAYAQNSQGYFPPVLWTTSHVLVGVSGSKRGWMADYIGESGRVLRCPDFDRALVEGGSPVYQEKSGVYWSSYFFVAGTGIRPPGSETFDGRLFNQTSTRENPKAPCTRLQNCGRMIESERRPIYVQPEQDQPLAMDQYDPMDGTWIAFRYTTPVRNNHNDGENIVYVDGHVDWKTSDDVRPRYRDFSNVAFW